MKQITVLAIAAALIAGPAGIATATQCFEAIEAIAFTSTRDFLPPTSPAALAASLEIYLMDPDGTNPRRLTENTDGDAFPRPSWDGKKIVFESNRRRAELEPLNTSDLFVMNTDGTEQTFLTRGSSATWSPDSKNLAFHASASGALPPIRPDPGAPAADSDIFVANVDDLLNAVASAQNITNSPEDIEEDADWSLDGKIVYTRHPTSDQPTNFYYTSKEIYVLNVDGTGKPLGAPVRLTDNEVEERGPAWSPDGTRIAYMCRLGSPSGVVPIPTFEICVMNADGTGQTRLTRNAIIDATPTWSLDGQRIVFGRGAAAVSQLFVINAELNPDGTLPVATQLTSPPGANGGPASGVVRAKCANGN
jgi:TolB protein